MNRVVLLGATGNLGHAIFNVIREKFSIEQVNRGNFQRFLNLNKEFDICIHAAGDIYSNFSSNPVEYINSNVLLTSKILDKVRNLGVKKFLFISSSAVYGANTFPSESDILLPKNMNGMVKCLNEKMVVDFCNVNKMEYSIFRVFNMYGGHDKYSIIYKLLNSFKSKSLFTLVNQGLISRDFVHVNDVANSISKILTNESGNIICNIGTGKPTSVAKLLTYVFEKYGASINVENLHVDCIESMVANVDILSTLVDVSSFSSVFDYLDSSFESF